MNIKELKEFLVEIIEYLNTKYRGQMDEQQLNELTELNLKHSYIINISEDECDPEVESELKEIKKSAINLYGSCRNGNDVKYFNELLNSAKDEG